MAAEKATILNMDTGEKLTVRFNPEEYTLDQNNNFALAAVPGRSSPLLAVHPRQPANARYGATLRHIRGDTADVRQETGRLTKLLDINPRDARAALLLFVWGSLRFTCVLAKASQKFILFRPSGARRVPASRSASRSSPTARWRPKRPSARRRTSRKSISWPRAKR